MYIDPELRDRVYQLFSLEVPKMLQEIETELVTLSIDRSGTKVKKLLRAAHSIKGGAASLGLTEITDLSHQIEDIFRVLNHPELPFDRKLELLLFEIYDYLNQLVTAEIRGEILPQSFHTKTQIVLANLDEEIGHFVIAGQQLPDCLLIGIDMTQSIFEIDVAQSLARLERVLLDPDCHHIVVGEFRAQSEVFTGIAALTNTPCFGKLAHATIAALDRHPHRAREMCCFALVDFYAALEAVLIGDRDACGQISPGFAFAIAEPPQIAITTEQTKPMVVVAGDLFDLEDLFDDLLPAFAPPDLELGGDFLTVGTAAPLEHLILDLNNDELESFGWAAEAQLDRQIPPQLDFPGLTSDDQDEFDFLIEDSRFAPAMAVEASFSFDLVDIFDLPSNQSFGFPAMAVEASFSFDLVDIFDLPRSLNTSLSSNNLEIMLTEITSNFDKFASITPSTFAPPPREIAPIRVKKSRKLAISPIPQLSVRVGIDRLERMNNLMGELAIERHGLALHNEQFSDTLARLRAKCDNFQSIGDNLRQVADSLAISAHQPPTQNDLPDEFSLNEDFSQEFDTLELDRYSEVHHIAQATIEQLAQIEEQIEDLSLFVTQSHHQIDRQKQLLSHLRDDLMWARMLPLGEILNRFPRSIHDLSIEFNKPVDLKIVGAGVLVDRAVIDKLFDPLVHLLRNAFDHGIDPLAARQAMNKPERGSIEINAYHQGSQTVIEIVDDGGGIDIERIKAKAIAQAIMTATDAATATRAQLLDLLFSPGFSTADRVTKLSGRGMGLDIVKEQIRSIKGTISIDSQVGVGSTFTLRIPLTLTIAQLMICQVGNAIYAFPADSIYKIVVPTPAELTAEDTQRIFHWRDLTIPIYNLADLLTYSIPIPERRISHTLKSSGNNPDDWLPPLLLIRRGDLIVAIEIDLMIAEQELTIVPFGKAITPPSYSYGCTILGDGIILPVIDPHTLIQTLVEPPRYLFTPKLFSAPAIGSIGSILVIDDSITTRQSLCLSLEKFGYRTLQAKDGQEALQILRHKTSEIKLVVCDVEMPNMNGFEFLNVYRQDAAISHIPVVMLTSRSNAKHRQFAAHLGAIDYFIKPYVEQDFMTAIGKIINN
ncbi:hybrid sensor histidine kinase/response regulator [Chamaesiphon sp. VAR_48_metabat_135_sub]|uniref:hybrid sensor histidine kinase/response regulator n=1 Tax=Chamaesiphon sp. VAR_48_metabat_135_sub TaxID=2964699 RepID=UPI00286AB590|nr:hybrid sensor histidine kinase/response regulator [Chamaesiphon sp. VAR_48_metabat_135_sub]